MLYPPELPAHKNRVTTGPRSFSIDQTGLERGPFLLLCAHLPPVTLA
jgi:hypothetical protein